MTEGDLYGRILGAVKGSYVALRMKTKLLPAGGPHDKVFPPTYLGGEYAFEDRLMNGAVVKTVLLDSVQSQANRMELCLLKAWKEKKMTSLPIVAVNLKGVNGLESLGKDQLTTLEVPHRLADAIVLNSKLGKLAFVKTKEGEALDSASKDNATPLLELCPTALLFGMWHSHGAKGGMGSKFARMVVSEIVGYGAVQGIRSGGRIDPLPVSSQVPVYESQEGTMTTDEEAARKDENGKVKELKPSNLGLGNVPPSFRNDKGRPLPGGVTMDHAEQTGVFSFIALRQLNFPMNGEESQDANEKARMVLATLALAAMSAQVEEGFDLRSRCLLVPEGKTTYELVPGDGSLPYEFQVRSDEAIGLFDRAVREARAFGLPWRIEPLILTPSDSLADLVRKSIRIQTGEVQTEEGIEAQ